jgi:signal transduction histidine kinase
MLDATCTTDLDTCLHALTQAALALRAETTVAAVLERVVDAACAVTGARCAVVDYADRHHATPGMPCPETTPALSVPLFADNGAITAYAKPGGFTATDDALLTQLSTLAGMALRQIATREAAERQAHAAAASEQQYRLIYETITQGIVHQDADGTFIAMNPAAERIMGVTRDDYLGQSSATTAHYAIREDGSPFPADEHPTMVALRTGQEVHDVVMGVFNPRLAAFRWISVTAIPLLQPGATRPHQVYAIFDDVTAVQEVDHAKDDFLAVLSHELQTPLTSMLGWAEIAMDQDSAELYRRSMPVIHRNAQRQKRLIDELIDISKLLHRRLDWYPAPIDLAPLVAEEAAALLENAAEAEVTLVVEPCGALPVTADPQRLRQCLAHLLHNGIKFTPAGGTVTVVCRQAAEWVEVAVHDTGRGLAPEALPTLFSLFHQVDRDETAGGLGLGLAIVRGILDLHGGTVTAESAGLGQGSTFTLRLPLRQDIHPSTLSKKER